MTSNSSCVVFQHNEFCVFSGLNRYLYPFSMSCGFELAYFVHLIEEVQISTPNTEKENA